MNRVNWLRVAVIVVVVTTVAALVAKRVLPQQHAAATAAMEAASRTLDVSADTSPPPGPQNPRTDRDRLLRAAYDMRGIPYSFGAKGPERMDCSGFTKEAYRRVGVRLPDGSFNQAKREQALTSVDDLQPGDLVFYRWPGSASVTHVTMYAGRGWMIGTGSPGQPPRVVLYPLSSDLRVKGTTITYRHIKLNDEQ